MEVQLQKYLVFHVLINYYWFIVGYQNHSNELRSFLTWKTELSSNNWANLNIPKTNQAMTGPQSVARFVVILFKTKNTLLAVSLSLQVDWEWVGFVGVWSVLVYLQLQPSIIFTS